MSRNKNVIWLASYPKSGNTWFRVFITNLLGNSEEPANINDLKETTISSSRRIFDDYTGLSSSDMTFEEIDLLRPEVYKMQSEETNDLLFKKVHDKYYFINKTTPLFPAEITMGCIYIIRNPLDVLVSFAYHSNKSIDQMIKVINDSEYAFCDKSDRQYNQLRQILGNWSDHVISWTKQKQIPVYIIRYEDMMNSSLETFSKAVKFIGIDKSVKQINVALEKSSFSVLSKQERKDGFKEKMIKSKSFFRKGVVGDWKYYLTEQQVNSIIDKHHDIMFNFGYIDSNKKPLF